MTARTSQPEGSCGTWLRDGQEQAGDFWRQDGSVLHSVLWERQPKTAVVWYRDDEVQGAEEFADPAEAKEWSSSLRDPLLSSTGEAMTVDDSG